MGGGSKNSDPHSIIDDQQQKTSNPVMLGNNNDKREYLWDEIRRHSDNTDRWIVIDKHVYNVTRWTKHPGGQVVLNHYAGQDATVRNNKSIIQKKNKFVFIGSFPCSSF
jgi:cytochrome b involved in lipid metabolism